MQGNAISRHDIIDLEAEALGIDPEMVSICQDALGGDEQAWAECVAVIVSARQYEQV